MNGPATQQANHEQNIENIIQQSTLDEYLTLKNSPINLDELEQKLDAQKCQPGFLPQIFEGKYLYDLDLSNPASHSKVKIDNLEQKNNGEICPVKSPSQSDAEIKPLSIQFLT